MSNDEDEVCCSTSAQLAVLAASTVEAADRFLLGIVFRLAGYAQSHARDGFATGIRNGVVTFFAVGEALATRDFVTGALDRVLDGCVDLILYRPVLCESTSH